MTDFIGAILFYALCGLFFGLCCNKQRGRGLWYWIIVSVIFTPCLLWIFLLINPKNKIK